MSPVLREEIHCRLLSAFVGGLRPFSSSAHWPVVDGGNRQRPHENTLFALDRKLVLVITNNLGFIHPRLAETLQDA